MYFDGHIHCRDWGEKDKETVKHGLETALMSGVDGILDMPNTKPAIITKEKALRRIALTDSYGLPVFYGILMGVTPNPQQIREAVETYREFFPRVAGLKMFAGRSTNNLSVIEPKEQELVYKTLSDCGYGGILVVHCEKQGFIDDNKFDYKNPITHCLARPPEAELESAKDQFAFGWKYEFRGTIHVAHVSALITADYISACKKNLGFNEISRLKISCGVTPHHLFLDESVMLGEDGNYYKVNPPLRMVKDNVGLLKHLKSGTFTCIETDHAPHLLLEKLSTHPPSGIPGIHLWPKIAKKLEEISFTQKQIDDLTFFNAVRLFALEKVIKRTNNPGNLNLQEYSYGNYL
ncbi:MAG: hypothetical protein Q8N88_03235 [Nanoarchaeota archaeon]|nr:hypothetical protein [Nanoarchaeota archaeon]